MHVKYKRLTSNGSEIVVMVKSFKHYIKGHGEVTMSFSWCHLKRFQKFGINTKYTVAISCVQRYAQEFFGSNKESQRHR